MIIPTKIPKGEAHYLAQMRAAVATGRKRGRHAPPGQLGDLAGPLVRRLGRRMRAGRQLGDVAGPLDDLIGTVAGTVRGPMEELRAGLTLAAAASTAAALGVVLLLFRTGRRGR